MGLLTEGEPLEWSEIKPLVEKLKWLGIEQFIQLYHKMKNRQENAFLWGDEIEYQLVRLDHSKKRAELSLRQAELLHRLVEEEMIDETKCGLWTLEFAKYMIESTPGVPYGSPFPNFKEVEENMRRRRATLAKLLPPNEYPLTISCFPRLGCPKFTFPPTKPSPNDSYSPSLFFPMDAICDLLPRSRLAERYNRDRRGSKPVINAPIFRDAKTPTPFREDFSAYGSEGAKAANLAIDDHVFMDAYGGGFGCSCLQVTIQGSNMDEARLLYDQLTPITPIMLALSAGTPIYRGYLIDWDTRWNFLVAAADDRTDEERGLRPLAEQKFRTSKSRCDTTDCYIHPKSACYNDIQIQYDQVHLQHLLKGGVDLSLAQHVAHLFVRDPMQVFREDLNKLDENDWKNDSEYFDDIQSSNWNNMRFKPPPTHIPSIGWRVEFRPMELQLTDFENAAYACFVVLLSRAIISLNLSFLIPISKVNENMRRASKRDAVSREKFYFRHYPKSAKLDQYENNPSLQSEMNGHQNNEKSVTALAPIHDYVEMSVDEIVNGKSPDFPGLVPLIQKYLDSCDIDAETRCNIQQYLTLIQGRAKGDLWTLAKFMREFVRRHADYKKDSVVNEVICYDLMKTLNDIVESHAKFPKLNGAKELHCKTGANYGRPG